MLHALIHAMVWQQTHDGDTYIEADCGWGMGCAVLYAYHEGQVQCLGGAVCTLQWLRWRQAVRLNSLALALTVAGRGQLGERLLSGWKVSALLCNQARHVHSHCRLLDLTRIGQVYSLGRLMPAWRLLASVCNVC